MSPPVRAGLERLGLLVAASAYAGGLAAAAIYLSGWLALAAGVGGVVVLVVVTLELDRATPADLSRRSVVRRARAARDEAL